VFHNFYSTRGDRAIAIIYHRSTDPWYDINPTEHNDRATYYGVSGIPHCRADGVLGFHPGTTANIQNAFNERRVIDSPVEMSIEGFAHNYGIFVTTTVSSGNTAVSGNYKLRLALVTNSYNGYTGSAGQSQWWHDMVDLAPTSYGLAFSIGTNETTEIESYFDWPLNLDGSPISENNVSIIAFIQNDANREVIQACKAGQLSDPWSVIAYTAHRWDDVDQAHPNGRADAGETVNMLIDLQAVAPYSDCRNVQATLSCDDHRLTISDDTGNWGTIESGSHGENTNDVFTISVPENFSPRKVTFYLDVTATDFERSYEFITMVGVPDILFVNDYGIGENNVTMWLNICNSAGFIPDVSNSLDIDNALLGNYSTVIWATGTSNTAEEVITDDEADAITSYLDAGGNMILSSQYAGDFVGNEDWFNTYFGADHLNDNVPAPAKNGAQGIEGGILPDALIAFDGYGGAGNYESPSSMTAVNGGIGLYTYLNVDDLAGVVHETDTYKTVYLGFPLEAVTVQQGGNYQPAHLVLVDQMMWIDPDYSSKDDNGSELLPSSFGINVYPNPFNSTVNIKYSLPAKGRYTLEVLNLLGQRVSLLEEGVSTSGIYNSIWSADQNPTGLYFIRLQTHEGNQIAKALLIK